MNCVVVAGNGGVGKTQLAALTFARARDTGADLVVWVPASRRDSIITTYAEAAAAVTGSSWEGLDVSRAAGRFLDWLATTGRRWLIVLDDVASPESMAGLWPEGSAGAVVTTTRLRDLGAGHAVTVWVDTFSPAESRAYLADRLAGSAASPPRHGALDEVVHLADDLGHLPVALAQASANIAHEAITCADYRRRFAEHARSLEELLGSEPPDEYSQTVATTWALAVDRADAMEPGGFARPTLYLASVLDPNGAPEALWSTVEFLQWAQRGSPMSSSNGLVGDGLHPRSTRLSLRNLHRLSLLTHDPNGGSAAVRTHPLVQRAIRDSLGEDAVRALLRVAADALAHVWPDPENDPHLCRTLRANAAVLVAHDISSLIHPSCHSLLFVAGQSIGDAGMTTQAVDHFTQLVRATSPALGSGHPSTLNARRNHAWWLGMTGDAGAAVEALDDLLPDMTTFLGPEHLDTLLCRRELARWRGWSGDLERAAADLTALCEELTGVVGTDHPDTLVGLLYAARWTGEAGDPATAAAILEGLVPRLTRVLGPDAPYSLWGRLYRGWWRGEAGDAATAHTELTELQTDITRTLGSSHPDTLWARLQAARWCGEAGAPARAVESLENVTRDMAAILGEEHPYTLLSRLQLGRWYGEAGTSPSAAAELQELLPILVRVLGPDDPSTMTCHRYLTRWQADTTGRAAPA
jgi:hypothetical protein